MVQSPAKKIFSQVSNEDKPGCLGYIRDEILRIYVGIMIYNQYSGKYGRFFLFVVQVDVQVDSFF